MLRYEYEQTHEWGESHPNLAGNQTVGPDMANFICNAALSYTP